MIATGFAPNAVELNPDKGCVVVAMARVMETPLRVAPDEFLIVAALVRNPVLLVWRLPNRFQGSPAAPTTAGPLMPDKALV